MIRGEVEPLAVTKDEIYANYLERFVISHEWFRDQQHSNVSNIATETRPSLAKEQSLEIRCQHRDVQIDHVELLICRIGIETCLLYTSDAADE